MGYLSDQVLVIGSDDGNINIVDKRTKKSVYNVREQVDAITDMIVD